MSWQPNFPFKVEGHHYRGRGEKSDPLASLSVVAKLLEDLIMIRATLDIWFLTRVTRSAKIHHRCLAKSCADSVDEIIKKIEPASFIETSTRQHTHTYVQIAAIDIHHSLTDIVGIRPREHA